MAIGYADYGESVRVTVVQCVTQRIRQSKCFSVAFSQSERIRFAVAIAQRFGQCVGFTKRFSVAQCERESISVMVMNAADCCY